MHQNNWCQKHLFWKPSSVSSRDVFVFSNDDTCKFSDGKLSLSVPLKTSRFENVKVGIFKKYTSCKKGWNLIPLILHSPTSEIKWFCPANVSKMMYFCLNSAGAFCTSVIEPVEQHFLAEKWRNKKSFVQISFSAQVAFWDNYDLLLSSKTIDVERKNDSKRFILTKPALMKKKN